MRYRKGGVINTAEENQSPGFEEDNTIEFSLQN